MKLKLVPVRARSFSGYKSEFLPQRMALLEPLAAKAFVDVDRALECRLRLTDMYRSVQTQIDSIRKASVTKKRLYAPPTRSGHQFGMSIDVAIDETLALLKVSDDPAVQAAGESREALGQFMAKFGWTGISSERWHFDFRLKHATVDARINAEFGPALQILSNVELQKKLNVYLKDMPPLDVDGVIGPTTGRYVTEAQKHMNLDPVPHTNSWFRRVLAGATMEVEMVTA